MKEKPETIATEKLCVLWKRTGGQLKCQEILSKHLKGAI